ncbi:MAG: hypothetical protein AB7E74_26385, partial [Pirellulales bacterium]
MGSSAFPAIGSVVQLASDPMVAPQIPGVAGQRASYGGVPYHHNGSMFVPSNLQQRMALPNDANIVLAFQSWDIDGNGSNNSAYPSATSVQTWSSPGTSGLTATSPANYTRPALIKNSCAGRDALYFRGGEGGGAPCRLDVGSSTTTLNAAHNAGTFTLIFAGTLMALPDPYGFVFYTADQSSENGFNVIFNSSRQMVFTLIGGAGGGGTICNVTYSTVAVTINQTFFAWIRCDGTNVAMSVNGGAPSSNALTTGNFGTGNASRVVTMGVNLRTTASTYNGELYAAIFANSVLPLPSVYAIQNQIRSIL